MPARTGQNEAQLASMASAIDRANRPVSFLLVPAALLIVAIAYLAWSGLQVRTASRHLALSQAQTVQIESLTEQIRKQGERAIDLAAYFPPQPHFVSSIQDTATVPGIGFARPPVIETERRFPEGNDPPLERAEIGATVQLENLDAVLEWIDTALNAEQLKGKVFLSQIRLQPISNGWGANIRFGVYRTPPGARR